MCLDFWQLFFGPKFITGPQHTWLENDGTLTYSYKHPYHEDHVNRVVTEIELEKRAGETQNIRKLLEHAIETQ